MTIDVSKIKPGDTVTVYRSASIANGGRYVTGPVWDYFEHLFVGPRDGATRIENARGRTVVSHIPAEPERPEWTDALVVRDGNGALWAADRGGLSGRRWTRIPNNFTSLQGAEWVAKAGPITVVIDAAGNNVEVEQ